MTASLTMSLEEFVGKKRTAQQDLEKALLPLIIDVLAHEPYDWDKVIEEAAHQWGIYYADEAGEAGQAPQAFLDDLRKALAKTSPDKVDKHSPERIGTFLSTAILSHSAMAAAQADEEDLFVEWVSMEDTHVRKAHREADGQQRPIGENFSVGGYKMPYPGYPGVPIELWINCRCTLRPVIANSMSASFRDVPTDERKKRAEDGTALPDGSFPIANCSDLRNAIQAIGRAKNPGKARAHIRKRKNALGCPDVNLPWAVRREDQYALAMRTGSVIVEAISGVRTFADGLAEPTHAGIAVIARDSGRVLMIQREWDEEDAPEVRGTWEFPGGGIEDGETPQEAAWREFCEETGLPMPEGQIVNGWRSPDGVYQGFVFATPVEADAFEELNPDVDAADTVNPDNPERIHPDVTAWFTVEQLRDLGPALRPEVAKMDWSVLDLSAKEEKPMTEQAATQVGTAEEYLRIDPETGEETRVKVDDTIPEPEMAESQDGPDTLPPEQIAVPWHGVWAPEGKKSGDRRRFLENSLRSRPLPLPMSWQKQSQSGHDGNIVVASADRMHRVDGEIRVAGYMLMTPEADEVIGLMAEFGRFGVSVDADDTTFELNEDDECVDFASARIASACIVPIPAFAEAWVSLGEPPEGFLDGPEVAALGPNDVPEEEEPIALIASLVAASSGHQFIDVAPGRTEDGPGWLTHPVDTDRLRDYWVRGAGAAKIGWGTPGDFNRCRLNLAKYVKPQYLAGYCANRHYDALGFWPGRPVAGETQKFAGDGLEYTDASPAMTLVASVGTYAPSEWFTDPEFHVGDPRLVKDKEGNFACPIKVTAEGEVYGHIAGWRTCHASWDNSCVLAPHSQTGYAHFLLGEVLTDEGPVAVGPLTIGGGHADPKMGMRPAMEHYDDAATVWADVNCGEDDFGIWVHGWVRPGTPPEVVHAARASKPSGDWRWSASVANLEMIAAHSVNTPGFAVPRIAAATRGATTLSLVAAGYVAGAEEQQTPEIEQIVEAVFARLEQKAERERTIAALATKFAEEE